MSTIVEEKKKDQKCPRCKCYAYPKDFINPTGRVLKTCQKCRDYNKKKRVKYHCEHGRDRNKCVDCGGSQICEHDRARYKCRECSDPIKVTIKQWIYQSRQSDKKYYRYDANNLIDKCFLKGLVEDYPECYYCTIPLQYIKYEDDMATIERIDNSLGHIKSNCVIACRKCNLSCIGDSRTTKKIIK